MLKFASLMKNTGDTFLTFQHFIHSFESMQLSTLVLLHIIIVFLPSTKVVEQSSIVLTVKFSKLSLILEVVISTTQNNAL